MTRMLSIGFAGFFGTLARYFLQGWIQSASGAAFPMGTLIVNVSGCFALGMIHGLFMERFLIDPQWRICLSIGFCGGFTTFSTLAFETVQLAGGHQWWLATVNVIASIVLGLVAVWLGTAISRAI